MRHSLRGSSPSSNFVQLDEREPGGEAFGEGPVEEVDDEAAVLEHAVAVSDPGAEVGVTDVTDGVVVQATGPQEAVHLGGERFELAGAQRHVEQHERIDGTKVASDQGSGSRTSWATTRSRSVTPSRRAVSSSRRSPSAS